MRFGLSAGPVLPDEHSDRASCRVRSPSRSRAVIPERQPLGQRSSTPRRNPRRSRSSRRGRTPRRSPDRDRAVQGCCPPGWHVTALPPGCGLGAVAFLDVPEIFQVAAVLGMLGTDGPVEIPQRAGRIVAEPARSSATRRMTGITVAARSIPSFPKPAAGAGRHGSAAKRSQQPPRHPRPGSAAAKATPPIPGLAQARPWKNR
jgi:hypothetical protein